jgi:hypothetical protein
MQTMPAVPGVASGRILSAGTMLVVAAGLALYQLTSLTLGPVSPRQLDVSLTIPAVEVQDLSERMAPNISFIVGTRATPVAPPSHATRVVASPRAASAPTAKQSSSHPLPNVLPTPKLHPADKKLPADD